MVLALNWRLIFYISSSISIPDLNSTVSLASYIVTFSISRLTNCSSYSSSSRDCLFKKSVISAIRCLFPSRSAFSTSAFCFNSRSCIFRPSESKETVGVSPPSREKQVQVHGRESTGVLFWKEMAKERFAKRSSACHLFRLESFSFAHGVIPIDEDLVGTVLNPVQHSIC